MLFLLVCARARVEKECGAFQLGGCFAFVSCVVFGFLRRRIMAAATMIITATVPTIMIPVAFGGEVVAVVDVDR